VKPRVLAITMGDPAGIGPEVIVRALAEGQVYEWCRPIVVGHVAVLRRALDLVGRNHTVVREILSADDSRPSPQVIDCISAGSDEVYRVEPGKIDARGGQAAYDALRKATELAQSKSIDAMVTAPLHKAALWQAGHRYPGHTELLAEWCGVRDFAMMLYLGPGGPIRGPAGLGIAHATLHMAIRDVIGNLTTEAIATKIGLLREMMDRLKGAPSQLAVAALNPHAGEEGLFGDEEARLIRPAVEEAKAAGIDVEGPLATDTLMVRARDGEFDGVVAMYHDQGHIALKLLGFHRAVNVTLGLPIVRTSVAHGTAFDIAGKGIANPASMIEAIRVAAVLAGGKPMHTRGGS
jgi:4-hydroxythreonine-4-phosphate dehydrogenase